MVESRKDIFHFSVTHKILDVAVALILSASHKLYHNLLPVSYVPHANI